MAERKATNKYYPPDWDPSKGSINKFMGQHPLRERARKLDQGILIVRFELPYNVWCLGCDAHVGTGVRFNAEKKRVGNYYSTPVLSFRMKCHLCSHWWEIRTDPKNTQYVVVSGAKQKNEEWDPEENGTLRLLEDKDREKINSNPLSRLEHHRGDKRRADAESTVIEQLQERSDVLWGDVYEKSKLMRKKFREEKRVRTQAHQASEKLRDKLALHIPLVPESPSDTIKAKLVEFHSANKEPQTKLKAHLIRPLFSKSTSTRTKPSPKVKNQPTVIQNLKSLATINTKLQSDPFLNPGSNLKSSTPFKHTATTLQLIPCLAKPSPVMSSAISASSLVAYEDSD